MCVNFTKNFFSPRDQSEDAYELAKASTSWMGGSSADNSFEDEEARNNSMGGGMSSQLFVYFLNNNFQMFCIFTKFFLYYS